MRSQNFTNSPIDHYIQADILSQLFKESELTFSTLKAGDVDNSLFMYHMRKLINRGVVKKTDTGFRLTTKGIRWINHIGTSSLQPRTNPLLLINFIIRNSQGSKILLSRRKGPAAVELNEYLLPGGLYPYSLTKQDAAQFVAHDLNLPDDLVFTYNCVLEKIVNFHDGFTHHTISTLFSTTTVEQLFEGTEHYALDWTSIEELLQNPDNKYDKLLIETVQKFTTDNLSPFESLTIEV